MADCGFDTSTGLACCWDITPCCPGIDLENLSPEDQELLDDAIAVASALMTRRSGYTIGLCAAQVRPLGPCSVCRDQLCCGAGDWLHLVGPLGMPVHEVTTVRIGADEVPAAQWRYDRTTGVLWTVPPLKWPRKDEPWFECGQGEAFCIDVVVGTPPDAWALDIAGALVCELFKSCKGEKCRLPKNATSITGQGITVTLSDQEIADLLPEVSGWIAAVNPHHAVLPARVYSPDLRPAGTPSRRGCCG